MLRNALSRQIDVRARLWRDVTWILYAALWVATFIVMARVIFDHTEVLPWADSHAYWRAAHGPMYTTGPMVDDAYLYSPAFAQAVWLPARLPWPVFMIGFSLMDAALLVWLLRPVGWKWTLPLVGLLSPEVATGNIFIPLAVFAVLGFRYPGLWTLSALTKVGTTVGPLWWAVRGEWRPLRLWAVTSLVVAAISAAIAPDLWVEWLTRMVSWSTESDQHIGNTIMLPLLYRGPIGIVLVIWGARTDRRWTVPVAMLLCSPTFWFGTLSLLAGIPRLARRPAVIDLPSEPMPRESDEVPTGA